MPHPWDFHDPANSSVARTCPLCGQPITYTGLIALSAGSNDLESWRFDCPQGHTIFADFTDEVDAGYDYEE